MSVLPTPNGPNLIEDDMTEPSSGSLSAATLASLTVILCFTIGALTFLAHEGSNMTEIVSFLSFIPNVIMGIILLRRQETAKEVLDKVEKNTNGNMSALIEKIAPVPSESPIAKNNGGPQFPTGVSEV